MMLALHWVKKRLGALNASGFESRLPIGDFVDAKLLSRRLNNRISFTHPSVGAFLAAVAMSLDKAVGLHPLDYWEPARTTARYLAAIGNVGQIVSDALKQPNDPLHRPLFTCASWLRYSPKDRPWRNQTLALLARILQDERRTYGERLRVLHALIAADEQPAKALFRRLLTSESPETRALGILGIGGLRIEDSSKELHEIIQRDEDPRSRLAALLALAAIGTTEVLTLLGEQLVHGEESNQILAAEALATHPGEGVPMLIEAAEMEGVRIRRASVYGLGRVHSDSVVPLLEKIQVEDDQAIVRNAASEVLEKRREPEWTLSPLSDDISSLPWLVAYAAESGLGVAPGKGALEMVRRALLSGKVEYQIAALEALGWYGGQEFVLDVVKALAMQSPLARNTAYETLVLLEASGAKITPKKAAARR
jgi:hypothetical protein